MSTIVTAPVRRRSPILPVTVSGSAVWGEQMEIRQLRYFAEVAAVGSFSGAAKRLSMAQPSLWRAVKTLESELGFPLFASSPRGVRLTRAGATMLARTHQLLELADGLTDLGRELKRGTDGLVVLGCASPQVPALIAPLIGELHRKHPGIHVALRNTEAIPDVLDVLSGAAELDFVTSPSTVDDDGVGRRLLAYAHVVVVTAKEHPWRRRRSVALEELAGVPVILAAPSTLSRQLIAQHLARTEMSLDVVFEADNLQTAIAMAAAGVGVAVVANHDDAAGARSRWPHLTNEGRSVSRPIWLYWLSERLVENPPAQRFIEVLGQVRESPASAV
ncbi:LysR family transcriptional regulator [Streptomyces griseorubiginosus]|uniref:LysR family transcriptional regulator n=1 Tax=Streptomyces griseorubiginosus TaxID=67304 RepID=UPI001AD720E7|nr:LysR family transcriptional regulator [Streptomyces griseorubiginosus]MBO4257446.1 LysR family transcriptional regulator [Streptomyces griseorubiginosus]